jgi:hypothetical protein
MSAKKMADDKISWAMAVYFWLPHWNLKEEIAMGRRGDACDVEMPT